MKELVRSHSLSYEVIHSEIEGITPHKVTVDFDANDIDLDVMFERFEQYLVACGFVLPDNTYVGLVQKG